MDSGSCVRFESGDRATPDYGPFENLQITDEAVFVSDTSFLWVAQRDTATGLWHLHPRYGDPAPGWSNVVIRHVDENYDFDIEGTFPYTIVSACHGDDNKPTFAQSTIEVSDDEVAAGLHHDIAERMLRADGYRPPFVHFDEDVAPPFLLSAVRHLTAAVA